MVKEQNADVAMNSPSLRETKRLLKVGYNTVLRTYKKHTPNHVTTIASDLTNIEMICEVDEQLAFENQR